MLVWTEINRKQRARERPGAGPLSTLPSRPQTAILLALFVPVVGVQPLIHSFVFRKLLGDSCQSRSSLSCDSKLLQNVPRLVLLIDSGPAPSSLCADSAQRTPASLGFPGL